MKKICVLILHLIILFSACSVSESVSEFTFESNTVNGKKLLLSFSAYELEGDVTVYGIDIESTSVSIADETDDINFSEVLTTPVMGQGFFRYYPDYDIQMKLFSRDEENYVGFVGIPTGENEYYTTIYVCNGEIFTIVIDLFPHVESVDEITFNGDTVSFYDLSTDENLSYRVDFERFTSKKCN